MFCPRRTLTSHPPPPPPPLPPMRNSSPVPLDDDPSASVDVLSATLATMCPPRHPLHFLPEFQSKNRYNFGLQVLVTVTRYSCPTRSNRVRPHPSQPHGFCVLNTALAQLQPSAQDCIIPERLPLPLLLLDILPHLVLRRPHNQR